MGVKQGGAVMKVLYWNVVGIKKKDENFWRYVQEFGVVGLVEAWIRVKKKGRASGRIIMGVRVGLEEEVHGGERRSGVNEGSKERCGVVQVCDSVK